MKKLIVFDLDGTLAPSKSAIDAEMAALLKHLLEFKKVAIISGGGWEQFEKQLLTNLDSNSNFQNLSLLPTCGTAFYSFESKWKKRYSEDFSENEKLTIMQAFHEILGENTSDPDSIWGERIEDRGSQITFSGLGQLAPLPEKEKWDPDSKRFPKG